MLMSEFKKLIEGRIKEYGDGEINNCFDNIGVEIGLETRFFFCFGEPRK